MITLAIDENGDWVFGKGTKDYKKNIEALKQDIITRIKEWKGDCFFDLEAGIDFINILGNKKNLTLLQTQLIKVISTTEGVLSVEEMNFNLQNNKLSINYMVNTSFGAFNEDIVIG